MQTKEDIRRKNAAYHRKNRERLLPRMRNRARERLYGVTPEQFDEMLKRQQGRCALCGSRDPGGRGTFHVDHSHKTGKVRSLLCHGCNTGLGGLQDDIKLLKKAISYLESHEA